MPESEDQRAEGSSLGKRRRPSQKEEMAKKARTSRDPAKGFEFSSARNPSQKIDCLVQVNQGTLNGDLTLQASGIAARLTLDAGLRGTVSFHLSMYAGGRGAQETAKQKWDIDDHIDGGWVI